MTNFDDREKAHEAKYVHDQEIIFKIDARRNKLLGLWAAELMGMSQEAAETYAREVIVADFEEAGDEDIFRKVKADLAAKGVTMRDWDLREKMKELHAVARDQVMKQ
ncbi:DUF1476 domain-containing protein [Oceanibacterium hippocampi]|uniref:DUF1476 domain-containing protein n=1 Tax=Oceanibacterium hippocampi TaxID=745714 RepID=A0A1Y5T8L0_9PROT|nr:DUF1476 domain-containing protein [Oceanibacterium hippocampi]SLN56236.1 hypothetical protein OCH7691_02436 [Oceanibacterium hippocampi]